MNDWMYALLIAIFLHNWDIYSMKKCCILISYSKWLNLTTCSTLRYWYEKTIESDVLDCDRMDRTIRRGLEMETVLEA
jgi:hypothetical protein